MLLKKHTVNEIRTKLFDLNLSSDSNKQLIRLIPGNESFTVEKVEAQLYTLAKKTEKLQICINDTECKSVLVCPVCLKNGIQTNVQGKKFLLKTIQRRTWHK